MGKATTSAVETRIVPLDLIILDGTTQLRMENIDFKVWQYKQEMAEGKEFKEKPVLFTTLGEQYWVGDGHIRLLAHKQLGRKEVACEVYPGGLREAKLFACGANASHGKKRDDATKKNQVRTLLLDPDICFDPLTQHRWSNKRVAELCHVSDDFVAVVRSKLNLSEEEEAPKSNKVATLRNGRPHTVDTTNLKGRKPKVVTYTDTVVDPHPSETSQDPPALEVPDDLRDQRGVLVPTRLTFAILQGPLEIKQVLQSLRQASGRFRELADPSSPLEASCAQLHIDEAFLALARDIEHCTPKYVCPRCKGQGGPQCGSCKGSGYLTENWLAQLSHSED